MKISVHALLILATTAKGIKVPHIRGDTAVASEGAADAGATGRRLRRWAPYTPRECSHIGPCDPHSLVQGRVCGNFGQNDEAYCNYLGLNGCIVGMCGLDPAEVYENRYWKQLPPKVQNLYGQLGYDEFWWDHKLRPPGAGWIAWSQLDSAQRAAATALGYWEYNWDSKDAGECVGTTVEGVNCEWYSEAGCNDHTASHGADCSWKPAQPCSCIPCGESNPPAFHAFCGPSCIVSGEGCYSSVGAVCNCAIHRTVCGNCATDRTVYEPQGDTTVDATAD